VAALYRVGYVDERFSAALTEAPVPPELKRLGEEYVAQYPGHPQPGVHPHRRARAGRL